MKQDKLRLHLFVNIIGVAILTIVIMAVLIVLNVNNVVESILMDKSEETVDIIQHELEHYLLHPIEEMKILKKIHDERDHDLFVDTASLYIEYFKYTHRVDYVDKDGIVKLSVPEIEGRNGFDLSNNDMYKNIQYSSEEFIIGEMIFDTYINEPTIYISMKVNDGYFIGYLNLDAFEELLVNVVISDGEIAIVDDKGVYISHTDHTRVLERIVDPYAALIREGEIENHEVVDYLGQNYLIQFQEINELGWQIIYYQEQDSINAPLKRLMLLVVIVVVILIPIMIYLIVLTIRRIDNSLLNLVNISVQVANGNYEIENTHFAYEEFEQLFEHFKVMSEKIEMREEEISGLNDELEENYYTMVVLLAKAIEAKDNYTGGHCERVRDLSMLLGEGLELSDEDMRQLKFGATLHDIGKLGIPESILNKPGIFSKEEYACIKGHSQLGYDIMVDMPGMIKAKQIILHHHERMDGKGYPYGLKGDEIPMLARIVSIADSFDAMTSQRLYRKNSMTQKEGFQELIKYSETQFDKNLVRVFIKCMKEGK